MQGNTTEQDGNRWFPRAFQETQQRCYFIDGLGHDKLCPGINLLPVLLNLFLGLFFGHVQVERRTDMERCLRPMDDPVESCPSFIPRITRVSPTESTSQTPVVLG